MDTPDGVPRPGTSAIARCVDLFIAVDRYNKISRAIRSDATPVLKATSAKQ